MSTDRDEDAPGRVVFQRRAVERDLWCCCLNCCHWGPNVNPPGPENVTDPAHNTREVLMIKKDSPGCTKWKSYPPAEVLVVGCDNWWSRVPF